MKKAFAEYEWLAGNHGKRGSLWLGPDHLLVVEGGGFLLAFSERYRRIDYRNIQALTVVRTARWGWMLALLAAGVLAFGLGALGVQEWAKGVSVTLLVAALGMLSVLAVHAWRGPSCLGAVQTTLQVLRLRPISRVKEARRVFARLAERCRLHQGPMPENLPAEVPPEMMAPPVAAGRAAPMLTEAKPEWPGSRWVIGAGLGLAVWGGMLAAELFVAGTFFLTCDLLVATAAFVMILIALVKASGFRTPAPLRAALWASLGLQVVAGLGLYMLLVVASVLASTKSSDGNGSAGGDAMYARLGEVGLEETEAWGYGIVALGVAVALAGLFMLPYGRRREVKAPPPLPGPGVLTQGEGGGGD